MIINTDDIKKIITDIFNLKNNSDINISLLGGMTNINYLVRVDNKEMVLRLPGKGTKSFINRLNEKKNSELTSLLEINTKVLYFDHNTGLKITEYLKNSISLTPITAKHKENILLVSDRLKNLHSSDLKFNNYFNIFHEFKHYWSLLRNQNIPYNFQYKKDVIEFFFQSEKILNNLNSNNCPCHNDLVAENILKCNNEIYFIDWEYSGMNDPMFDVAALFLECNYSSKEKELFLYNYFGKEADINELKKIQLFQFTQDVLWTIWTMVKEENGENFENYGVNRLMRAYETMNEYKNNYA
ncbi:phosphotransferase [Xenorhabdus stockiae]|uniref:phosphotransferase n=1 Tax=Xenorhabdus stockiae TaxID=351614 RepID=UPI0040636867